MSLPTAEILSILAASGWTVESEAPLAIRHDASGDCATGVAAVMVAEQLLLEMRAEGSCLPDSSSAREAFAELAALAAQVDRHVAVAHAAGTDEAWATAARLVFGKDGAERAVALLARLNHSLDYREQEACCREDVCAYQLALSAQVAQLRPFLDEPAATPVTPASRPRRTQGVVLAES